MASVTVMGAGAVGSYYGALLARAGHRVSLVARGAHLESLREQGEVRVREPDGTEWAAPVAALAAPDGRGAALAILTTKSQDTPRAARALAGALGARTPVLSLQNGVQNVERAAAALGEGRVIPGLAFVGLRVAAPGLVERLAEGRVLIGEPGGGDGRLARAVHRVVAPAWDVAVADDIVREQWRKLAWNVGFNALCAVTGATVGEVLATPETALVARGAMAELGMIARRSGVELTAADLDEMAAPVPGLERYLPSTAQDLAAGKRLEREALCGFVLREGARMGVPTPVNRVLDAMLALAEDRATAAARTAARSSARRGP
jgi:2-dehydropantoate 2-reductase